GEGQRTKGGYRSTSCDHARLHGVQAAELSDEQVQAEHAGPLRDEEILPLVRESHAAPGDPLVARSPRTRRKRRDDDYQAPASSARAREQRPAQIRPTQPSKSQTGAQRERGGGFRGFIGESWAELKKVE